jgi:hypothetical protein
MKTSLASLLAFLVVLLAGQEGARAQTPLFGYYFGNNSSAQWNFGTATNNAGLTMKNSSGTATDLCSQNTGGTLGPSGNTNNFVFDNTSATGMGSSGTGGQATITGNSTNLANLTSFTITGWLNPSTVMGNAARIVDATGGTSSGFMVFATSNGVQGGLTLTVNGTSITSPVSYAATNSWIFFAVSYDSVSGTAEFYVSNNSPSAAVTQTGSTIPLSVAKTTGQGLVIGGAAGTYARPFKGYLDDIEIFASASDSSGALPLATLQSVHDLNMKEAFDDISLPAYCPTPRYSTTDYNNMASQATGTNPLSRTCSEYVLEAFARASNAQTGLGPTDTGNVLTALTSLQNCWVSSSNNFKSSLNDAATSDPNMVELVGEYIDYLPYRYPNLLAQYGPVSSPTSIEGKLAAILAECKTGSALQSLPVTYTNMWLLRDANLTCLAQGEIDGLGTPLLAPDPATVNTARTYLMQWTTETQIDGVHEYLSPTYTGLQLEALDNLYLFADDPGMATIAWQGNRLIWMDMYANWYGGTQRLGGTHSRSYNFLYDFDSLTDRFCYAASTPLVSMGWPQLMNSATDGRSTCFWAGWDYVSTVVSPPSDVPNLFSTFPRTVLRRFSDTTAAAPFMYEENYADKPAGTGGFYYPYNISSTQAFYNDVVAEGFTIELPGPAATTPNINFNTQTRKDFYLQSLAPDNKSDTAQPFIASVQKGAEVIFLAASNGKNLSTGQYNSYNVDLASTLIFPSTAKVWIGSTSTSPQTFTAGQSVSLTPGTTIFIQTVNAGQSDSLVTGLRFLLTTDMSGNPVTGANFNIVNDGPSGNAMRITCEHSPTAPTSGYGTFAFWSRTAYCANSTSFNTFRTSLTSATPVVTVSGGTVSISATSVAGTTLALNCNPSTRTTTSITGGDVEAAASPVFMVNNVEYANPASSSAAANDTLLNWTSADIGGATGGSHTQVQSGGLYTGQIQVVGGGTDIWGTSDSFHFVYQKLIGDGSIIGRLTSMPSGSGISTAAKAALMLRPSLAATNDNVYAGMMGTSGVRWSHRNPANSDYPNTDRNGDPTVVNLPLWFKITRSSNQVTGYYSPDGVTWTVLGTPTVDITSWGTQPLYAGLAVTSANNSQPITVMFDNVGILPAP